MAALGALGSVEFDDEFLTAFEQSGQAGTVPAGALDRPHSQCAVLVGEVHQILVAIDSGRHGDLAENSAGAGGDRRSGVVSTWVSTPMTTSTMSVRMVMRSSTSSGWDDGSGPDGSLGRTVTGHGGAVNTTGQAPDQASRSTGPGPTDHERTSPAKGTKPVR